MAEETTLFRARVSARRLRRAERILRELGLKPGDAFNMMLAQIELRGGLPFDVTTKVRPVISPDEQGTIWRDALGEY